VAPAQSPIKESPTKESATKDLIILTAERLLAAHGIDGVSLRQIGAAAGNGNNSAVQYHFGSKDRLVQAIFEFRLAHLNARRLRMTEDRRPAGLRAEVECYLVPLLEQGEEEGSHYLSFIAMLQQHGRRDIFERIPAPYLQATESFRCRVAGYLPDIPEALRSHRIAQAMSFSVQAAADRERARADGRAVLPFVVHVADLLDGLVGFLEAPASPAALAAVDAVGAASAWPVIP
jgi:AcrR family transcriptional regulator